MRFETGLEFGRHAAMINEAYAKMVKEAEEPMPGDDDYISDEEFEKQKKTMQSRRERREREMAAAKADGSNAQLKNSSQEMEDLLFAAGKSTDDFEGENDGIEDGDEGASDDTPAEDNFYENVIEANPDVFNEESYDMESLKSHKKEIMDKAMEYLILAYPPVKAVETALDEIPGCEYRGTEGSDEDDNDTVSDEDNVGNIDGDDVEGDTEVPTAIDHSAYKSDRDGSIPKSVDGFEDDETVSDGDYEEIV